MPDQKRGDDAADHAPKPQDGVSQAPPTTDKQDGANYKNRVDGGLAEPVENVNSANDQ